MNVEHMLAKRAKSCIHSKTSFFCRLEITNTSSRHCKTAVKGSAVYEAFQEKVFDLGSLDALSDEFDEDEMPWHVSELKTSDCYFAYKQVDQRWEAVLQQEQEQCFPRFCTIIRKL
jgi:hypothetical protein